MKPVQIDHETETELLIKLREGEEYAFNKLYDRYSLRIYRKLLKMVKIDVLADELTQDVFVKVWTKRHLIDPEQSFRSYLFSIAQHLVYDVYRKSTRDENLASEIKAISTASYTHTEEVVYLKETEALLNRAINQLPPQQKIIFTACKMEGKSYEVIANELGISISTVNGHIVKASKTVAAFLLKSGTIKLLLIAASALMDF